MGIKGFKERLRPIALGGRLETYEEYFAAYISSLRARFGPDVYIVIDSAHLLYLFSIDGLQHFLAPFLEDPSKKVLFVFDNPPSSETSSVKSACRILDTLKGDLTRVCGHQASSYKVIYDALGIDPKPYTADRAVFCSTPKGEKYVVVSVDNDMPIMMSIYPDCLATAIVAAFQNDWNIYSITESTEREVLLPMFVRDKCTGLAPLYQPPPMAEEHALQGGADIGGGGVSGDAR
jgi:hypothetical protein